MLDRRFTSDDIDKLFTENKQHDPTAMDDMWSVLHLMLFWLNGPVAKFNGVLTLSEKEVKLIRITFSSNLFFICFNFVSLR